MNKCPDSEKRMEQGISKIIPGVGNMILKRHVLSKETNKILLMVITIKPEKDPLFWKVRKLWIFSKYKLKDKEKLYERSERIMKLLSRAGWPLWEAGRDPTSSSARKKPTVIC